MAFFSVEGLNIKGISTAVPTQSKSVLDYDLMSDSEKKMFVKTVGVENRRVAEEGVTSLDLGVHAANQLFQKIGWEKESVDLLVFVTQSRDFYLPSMGPLAQHKLGLSTTCMAFDIGLGCSGYVYGLSIVASMLKSSNFKRAILLAGDVSTISSCYSDRSTYPLFGDAVTATFVENSNANNKWSFELYSDGSGEEAIKIPYGGLRNLPTVDSFEEKERGPGIKRSDLHLALNGIDIFNFSVSKVPKSINDFLLKLGMQRDEIDYFVMHQANKLMNETIRKKVSFEIEKTPYSLKDFGNTSSASIPLTIVTELEVLKSKKSTLLLSGFGVGLSWANALVENDLIEYLLLSFVTEKNEIKG